VNGEFKIFWAVYGGAMPFFWRETWGERESGSKRWPQGGYWSAVIEIVNFFGKLTAEPCQILREYEENARSERRNGAREKRGSKRERCDCTASASRLAQAAIGQEHGKFGGRGDRGERVAGKTERGGQSGASVGIGQSGGTSREGLVDRASKWRRLFLNLNNAELFPKCITPGSTE
jgi:hypothetical protein